MPVINSTRILSYRPPQRLRSHPFPVVMTTCIREVVSAWIYGVTDLHAGNKLNENPFLEPAPPFTPFGSLIRSPKGSATASQWPGHTAALQPRLYRDVQPEHLTVTPHLAGRRLGHKVSSGYCPHPPATRPRPDVKRRPAGSNRQYSDTPAPPWPGFHPARSLGQSLEKTKHNVYGISKAGQLMLSG